MNYINNAFHIILKNPYSYCLFLFANCPLLDQAPIKNAGDIHIFIEFIISTVVGAISLFLISGIYHQILKQDQSQRNYHIELYQASKRYFFRVLIITLWIGLVAFLSISMIAITFKIIIRPSSEMALSVMRYLPGTIGNILVFGISVYFIYSIPSVYSNNLSETQAISTSFKFLRLNLRVSKPLIIFLALSFGINAYASQFINDLDNKSELYWMVLFANELVTNTINLVVVIAAFLVLKERFSANKYLENI